jgi:N-acetylneuraminic acid mutarotase
LKEDSMKTRFTKLSVSIIFLAAFIVAMNLTLFAASGTWAFTGSVHSSRDGHTATRLNDGTVLVAGGELNNVALDTSEIYSQSTGLWSTVGNLNVARVNGSAVLLADGTALVMGGCVANCQGATTPTAEIYHPTTRHWSLTGNMSTARAYFGAVMLPGGKIIVAGGCTTFDINGCAGVTARAEIYDPSTDKWSTTGSMAVGRGALTLTMLPNGKVLAAGGQTAAGDALASSELYNPATGRWSLTGKMNVARDEHTALLLAGGNVLAVGGEDINGISTAKTELYNPSTGKWTLTGNLITSRIEHTATLLMNGNVLISGGMNVTMNGSTVLSSAEVYNPATGVWTRTGSMHNARTGHTATLLHSGMVLDSSGSGSTEDLTSAELYTQ